MENTQGSTSRRGGGGSSASARNGKISGNVEEARIFINVNQLISHGLLRLPRCEVKLVRVDVTNRSNTVPVPIPRKLRKVQQGIPGEVQESAVNQSRRGSSIRPGKQEGSKRLKCPQCSRTFSLPLTLTLHQKMRHGNKGSKSVSHAQRQRTQVGSSDNQRSGIGGSFSRKKRGPLRFQCYACTKSFSQKRNLTTHQKVHQNPDAFKCTLCPRRFKSATALLHHRNIHTGRFRCKVCQRNCHTKNNLNIHQRTHTGEKPFSCGECNKRFATKSGLGCHQKGFHDKELLYSCPECDRKFNWNGVMQHHVKACRKRHMAAKLKKSIKLENVE